MEELKPIYDNALSFYGKAKIVREGYFITLKSYDTNILRLNTYNNEIKFLTKNKKHFTQTTNRHINEFLQQFTDEGKKTKSQILKMAGVEA